MPGKKTTVRKTIHVSVPVSDTDCMKWLEAQENVSASFRCLIHKCIKEEGFVDTIYKTGVTGHADDSVSNISPVRCVNSAHEEKTSDRSFFAKEKINKKDLNNGFVDASDLVAQSLGF